MRIAIVKDDRGIAKSLGKIVRRIEVDDGKVDEED